MKSNTNLYAYSAKVSPPGFGYLEANIKINETKKTSARFYVIFGQHGNFLGIDAVT